MGFEGFRDSAKEAIDKLKPLAKPISSIQSGYLTEDLSLGGSTEKALSDLTVLTLKGSLTAAVHLTRRPDAPEDLDKFEPVQDETQHAIGSMVIDAQAGAEFKHQQTIGTGLGITAGADAAARFAFAQHRRYPLAGTGLAALSDLLRNFRNPYDVDALRTLTDHELFHIELTGSGNLVASAGWEWGVVRSFEGTDLEKLVPGDLGGVSAQVTAGVSVRFGVEGRFRVFVDRSPRDPSRQVRVRLLRKRGHFVGAGLSIKASAQLTQPESFVDSVFTRLLQVPDGFVAQLGELRTELHELQAQISGLAQSAKDEIAEAAGVGADALDLDRLESLRQTLGQLPPAVAARLEPFLEPLDSVAEKIGDLGDELTQFVDDTFTKVTDPLETLTAKIDSWITGYEKARQKAVAFIQERAKQGIQAEITAGINRSKTSEALLELDFDLDSTSGLLIEAMKGNFTPALERARTTGATGVEIVSGTLKETTKKTRFYNLRFNIFGFKTKVDFERFNEKQLETDAKTGVLSISGKSGASLTGETNRRRNELSFLFDIYGVIEQRGDKIFTTPETSFKATVKRSGEIRKTSQIKAIVPRHLEGARGLKLIGPEREGELRGVLLANRASVYTYELDLAFPPSSVSRMLSLDLDESDKLLRKRLWRWMREAVEALDYPVPHSSGIVPLSSFFIDEAIAKVENKPVGSAWREIDHFRGPNNKLFQDGAYRMAWAYLLNARTFIGAYLATRKSLLEGVPLKKVLKKLTGLAAKTVKGAGTFSTRPFDAKYLVFALAEGLREVEIEMTFKRGSVDVTI